MKRDFWQDSKLRSLRHTFSFSQSIYNSLIFSFNSLIDWEKRRCGETVFSRRGAVRCETNAKLETHWSAATVVGRPRAKERKFEKQIHRLRSRAHQGGRCSSTAGGIRKYGNSIRSRSSYASHRIASVESSRRSANARTISFAEAARATESFSSPSLLAAAARFSNFVRREDNKIVDRDIGTDRRERREKLVTAKLIHDGRISPRRGGPLNSARRD